MRTVRRLFWVDVVSAVAFVAVAFVALFLFIDFVDELGDIGKRGRTAMHAVVFTLLRAPSRSYELIPIAVLIGTIFALARLAQTSQYTILRTGGLGPGRALRLLASIALFFAVVTFAVGDWLTPLSERLASQFQGDLPGGIKLQRAGAWIKDRTVTADGPRSYAINIGTAESGGELKDVRIFEFGGDGKLVSRTAADAARVQDDGTWRLTDVTVSSWAAAASSAAVAERRLATLDWRSSLSRDVVAAAVLPSSTMSTLELWRYIGHLSDNEQAAQEQKIQFWRRALYPFACFVMVGLALPFAYLSARSAGVSLKVFIGIMIGVSFVLLNTVFRHLGLLGNWTPWIVAAAPGALYLLLSLAAFSWLVRYR